MNKEKIYSPAFGVVQEKVDNRWIITAICTDKGWVHYVVDMWRTRGISITYKHFNINKISLI